MNELEKYPKKTTKEMLQKNICYCNHQKQVIKIEDCKLLDGCRNDKKCREKSRRDYDRSIKE